MTTPTTLADSVYQFAHKKPNDRWNNTEQLRASMREAHRFVLDADMSRFLVDIADAAFRATSNVELKARLIEQLRNSARLPHRKTWVEYNLHQANARMVEIGTLEHTNPKEVSEKEGWLLERHPSHETAFRVTVFLSAQSRPLVFPVAYQWVTDSSALPWMPILPPTLPGKVRTPSGIITKDIPCASVICGLTGYQSEHVNITNTPYAILPTPDNDGTQVVLNMLQEWMGVVRRMWALLATINDIPVLRRDVVASRGFIGKGSYHRYLDHKVLTLNIPQGKDVRKVARQVVAMTRRRAHDVRGFWRRDFRRPLFNLCTHEFNDNNICKHCSGHRIWVHEHERGDRALGYIGHDYNVTHNVGEQS